LSTVKVLDVTDAVSAFPARSINAPWTVDTDNVPSPEPTLTVTTSLVSPLGATRAISPEAVSVLFSINFEIAFPSYTSCPTKNSPVPLFS